MGEADNSQLSPDKYEVLDLTLIRRQSSSIQLAAAGRRWTNCSKNGATREVIEHG